MALKPKTEINEIEILDISQGEAHFRLVGDTPLIFNRMAEKAKRELLMPSGRKTGAARALNQKHDPVAEFRNSVYRYGAHEYEPTRLKFPTPAFKGCMGVAALDLPGLKRTELGRLVWVVGEHVHMFGVPKLLMSVVRSADMNRTPDIRTRAILPKWACTVHVRFITTKMTAKALSKVMAAGGITSGIGDFRQEKGKGSFGQFHLVDADDKEFDAIVAAGGRAAQDEALEHCVSYDNETQELMDWYKQEYMARSEGRKAA